jgi:hypothetical protein
MLLVHLRDIEGRLQRYAASVAQLINLHAPFSYIVQSDWPVYRLMHMMSLLQRSPPKDSCEPSPNYDFDAGDAHPQVKTMNTASNQCFICWYKQRMSRCLSVNILKLVQPMLR